MSGHNEQSVGVVETQYFTFAEDTKLVLESGEQLGPVTIAYETYGALNADKSNAILVLHALSGDAHAAGSYAGEEKSDGWWDNLIGPGKGIDTNKYFVICSNVIGGCKGSTGPASINSETGKPYGLSFPVITISDMVRAQKYLIESLGIECLLNVIGGSMGGMQVLEWTVQFSQMVKSATVLASTARITPQQIAFHEVGRNAIYSDANWNKGDYYDGAAPDNGLAVARMLGHITYLSDESMMEKFGRRLRQKKNVSYDFSTDFEVESYLRYQGNKFVARFDANSFLYITKAMDYFDITRGHGLLSEALKEVQSRFLVMSFSSDWLFPPYQSKDIVKALMANNKDVTYCDIDAPYGHDAFLIKNHYMSSMIQNFLASVVTGKIGG